MLLSDFINESLTRMSVDRLGQFLLAFTFINILQSCILQGRAWSNGYSFLQAFNMYIVGFYLKRKKVSGNKRVVLIHCVTSPFVFMLKTISDYFLLVKWKSILIQ